MSHQCPACSAEVPGVVTQTTLESRLHNQKTAHNEALKLASDRALAAESKAGQYDALKATHDATVAELAKRDEAQTRRASLASLNVAADMDANFSIFYRAAVAGLDDAARPTFEAWLAAEEGGARSNPLLAPLLTGEAPPAGAAAAPAGAAPLPVVPAPPAASFPPAGRGAAPGQPGAPQGRMAPAELRAHLQSMTPDQRLQYRRDNSVAYGDSTVPIAPPA